MNNVAIEGNPCASVDKRIPSDGTFKVAKMSSLESSPKIQTLASRWQKELAKMPKASDNTKVGNTAPKTVSAASVMSDLDATVSDFYSKVSHEGARKLKVNPIVANKSRNVYGKHDGIVLAKKEEVVNEVVEEKVNNIVKEEPVVDSRMSRLERTNEDYTSNREPEYSEPQINKVVNTPTRFERYNENPYEALINDNAPTTNDFEERTKTSETRGGDPNLYNELIHGAKNDDVSSQLLDARNKLSNAQKEKAKAKAVNKSLEDEVANLRKTIEAIKREKQEQDEKELSNTLNMLEATKEEILGETRKYDNLQEELAELIRQKDSLLNGTSSYDNSNNFSRSRM